MAVIQRWEISSVSNQWWDNWSRVVYPLPGQIHLIDVVVLRAELALCSNKSAPQKMTDDFEKRDFIRWELSHKTSRRDFYHKVSLLDSFPVFCLWDLSKVLIRALSSKCQNESLPDFCAESSTKRGTHEERKL